MKRQSIKFRSFGRPESVLFLHEDAVAGPGPGEVLVRVLAAPINPVDLLIIQECYATKPTNLPAVGGSEGVGDVLEVGEGVEGMKPGDRVAILFPAPSDTGTWTTHAVYPEENLLKVPKTMSVPDAAAFSLNPATAYLMLKSYVDLQPGDTVIQNVANSSVGQIVHQLCKNWGIKSVGIIRDRTQAEDTRTYLKSLGATEVLTETELMAKTNLFREGDFRPPKLGLSAYGGKATQRMVDALGDRGCLVTYGVLNNEPVFVDAPTLIFKDLSFRGFAVARWLKDHPEEKNNVYAELLALVESGHLKMPRHELIQPSDFQAAVNSLEKGRVDKKLIFDFSFAVDN